MMQIYASSQSEIPTSPSKGEVSYPVGSSNYVPFEEEHTFPQYEGPAYGTGINILSNYGPTDGPGDFSYIVQDESVSSSGSTVSSVPGPNSIILLITGVLIVVSCMLRLRKD